MNDTSKPSILKQAVILARKQGLYRFSRRDVATAAEVSLALVSYHFGSMGALRQEVLKVAVTREILPILADARSSREATEIVMTETLRKKVAAHISR